MIRKAKKTDAMAIAPLLYNALHEIAEKITGSTVKAEVLLGLETWFSKENNRLSYENCFVYEQDESAVGIIVAYHGSEATQLDAPIVHHLRELHKDESITLEKEAELDEYYIDTLSVSSAHGGKGIGSKLIEAAEIYATEKGHEKIALLVNLENTRAYSLYEKLGYKKDEIVMLVGEPYAHLVKTLNVKISIS
ncbi:GNAT family N-acetyltransferase [Bacillus thuringiensis]|uniref:Acetyltransferase n=4 Tax=Bacillus cereus group TaxID=86661 RepID=A0A9W5QXJ2_BACCE|nr:MULTISPECIES: GNAT family N-acetyltransferase [Bacillus]MED1154680.1 GNAT family N-acetyltransferase [Bacillus paranthracis]AFQ25111.1 GNAT family acetyltransferase [Bacillus thuringiensis HD-789]AJH08940.1 acetyltransferase domain protein [Bacillus thuringiensis HD1002]AND06948.1 acetyltransferase [Bacillus thuringiensis serovar alesti]AND23319.1 acetyltransferase [Bacillus thuringiensis serovar israelensis]